MNEYLVWLPGLYTSAPEATVVTVKADDVILYEGRLVFSRKRMIDGDLIYNEMFATGCWSRWKLSREGVE